MPDPELEQYRSLHATMSQAIVSPPAPVDDAGIMFLDVEEARLEAEPDEEDEMVALDVETGEVAVAAQENESDRAAEEIDYAAVIKQAFLDAFEKSGGVEAKRKLEVTLSRPENWDEFLGGVLIGIPTGVVKDIVEQVTWAVSMLSDLFEAMPKAATGAAQTWSDIVDWVSDPQLWAAARDLYQAAPGSDEFMRALLRLRDKLPAWVLSVAEALAQLYDVAKQVPEMLEDEEFKRAALVTGCQALAGSTESLVKVLETGDNKADLQGEAVGIILGQYFSYALIMLLLGPVRLPAKLGAQAVESGMGIAKGFAGAASSAAAVTARHGKIVAAGTQPALAKLKAIIQRHLADRSRQRGHVDILPMRRRKKPGGRHPGGTRGPKYDPRLPPAIRSALSATHELLKKYGGKGVPYRELYDQGVKPLNKLSKAAMPRWARLTQSRRVELNAHHVVEKQFIKFFTKAERQALDWVKKTVGTAKWKPSDSMPAVLAQGEGHVGTLEALTRGGKRMKSDLLKNGPLPSLNPLDKYVSRCKPKNAREVLDAHERWYRSLYGNPPHVFVNKRGQKGYNASARKQLTVLLDELDKVRATLDQKVPGWRDR